ncbi:MAG: molybdopterin-dependent oxidoreductase, partial [Actinomycetia bacterium]|nr:molybdopterin-dependent oxidoreductase [Actinomycetes bacterium]
LKDSVVGGDIDPELTFIDSHAEVRSVAFDDFVTNSVDHRGVPVRYIETERGPVAVATVFDLLMARFGVNRGLSGAYPDSYDDENAPYTPAWQEQHTGIHRDTLLRFARDWGANAEATNGKNLVIIGAGANHWYHNNLLYRSAIVALMLTGSVGVNGGGLAHYVGQEKLVMHASWGALAFGGDWGTPPRHQNTPSWHYVHSDQWRYEKGYSGYDSLPPSPEGLDHTMDQQARAVRRGWLPFYPQFKQNPIEVVRKLRAEGAATDADVVAGIVEGLKTGSIDFAIDDPDAPESWPRVWLIWRGNAIGTSAKGHEFFLRHYLGTHSNAIAKEPDDLGISEITVRDEAPKGKMDLVVDLNFRMDTTALYSDIVLPAATWYEKDDLNTTDMHSFINPMQAAVAPSWESRSDWNIFGAIAREVSDLAPQYFDGPVEDVVMLPLQHDTVDEISQPFQEDWWTGEVEAIPGKTMPKFKIVKRDLSKIAQKWGALGPGVRANGVAAHGLRMPVEEFYDELARKRPTYVEIDGEDVMLPSLERDRDVCEMILALDPASNGELAFRAFEAEEKKTGLELTHLAEGMRDVRYN